MKSVLSKASKSDILFEPYPHLVIQGALEEAVFKRLETSYPGMHAVVAGQQVENNKLYLKSAYEMLEAPDLLREWKEFIAYHVSSDFLSEVITLFDDAIHSLYPELKRRLGKNLDKLKTGVRRRDTEAEIFMDCQFAVNSPVTQPSSVRGPHVDNPVELYAGLLYFREDNDDSIGGDLEISRFKKEPRFFGKAEADPRDVETAKIVRYAPNTLVFFINSIESLHGVTPRMPTHFPRRFVNIIGELSTPLFNHHAYKKTPKPQPFWRNAWDQLRVRS